MTHQPTGTITLLFTDIEGSTSRWEHHPDAMRTALAGHDALLRSAIEAHAGHVFKTVGDAFYAAFGTASAALNAALDAQHALASENWGSQGPLRVRMALHTGAVEARDNDYFGQPLNRVARMLSAGHGSQILLSEVTYGLIRDALPVGITTRDLGEHRLKDLIRPERIFQLIAPTLPADFPPLKTLNTRPTNLPVQPTPMIGREYEVTAVRELVLQSTVRLLTLLGPGGMGKTRLSLQVAAELIDEFADGVFFVNLAPISDPALVVSTIAQTLHVNEAAGQPLQETLQDYLRDKQLLLLLDNFEQVLHAASLVSSLLATAAHLKILVTSRASLRIRGEHEFLVTPLAVPSIQQMPPIERLTQYDAVRLFIERAQAVKSSFEVTSANAPAVAEICARLDGLPLSIELAAARVKLLSPDALLQRLSRRLTLLTGGARDLPARQQTLRGAIDWSYNLLDPAEQLLFARLAVFVGGGTLDAIEAVCNVDGDLPIDTFDGVASLVDNSLLRQVDGPAGEPRFVMLETIHEYARERLHTSSEAETVQHQHATYFLALSEQAEPELVGPEQVIWLERLESEHDNFRAVLRWALQHGEVEMIVQLGGPLSYFWIMRGHLSEGRRWLDEILAASHIQAAAASLSSKRPLLFARAGDIARTQGDYMGAKVLHEEALSFLREANNKRGIAALLRDLAYDALDLGDLTYAQTLAEESLALRRELGNKWGIWHALESMGSIALAQGNYARAAVLQDESLNLSRDLGDKSGIAICRASQGLIALYQNQAADALPYFRESLVLSQELGDKIGIAGNLEGIASVAAVFQCPLRAAWLWGAATALREAIGAPVSPAEQVQLKRMITAARDQLNEAVWEAAWAEGRATQLEQAVAYALEEAGNP